MNAEYFARMAYQARKGNNYLADQIYGNIQFNKSKVDAGNPSDINKARVNYYYEQKNGDMGEVLLDAKRLIPQDFAAFVAKGKLISPRWQRYKAKVLGTSATNGGVSLPAVNAAGFGGKYGKWALMGLAGLVGLGILSKFVLGD